MKRRGGLSMPEAGGGGGARGGGEPKKKRRKMKKESGTPSTEASVQVSDAEDGRALFSGAEDEKPMKKVPSLSSFKILKFWLMGRTADAHINQRGATRKCVTRDAQRGRAHDGRTAQKAIVRVLEHDPAATRYKYQCAYTSAHVSVRAPAALAFPMS